MVKQYKNLVFDLGDVLFSVDKIYMIRVFGFWNIIKYVCINRADPSKKVYQTLDYIAHTEYRTTPAMAYKDILLPSCMVNWIAGKISNQAALTTLREQIAQLAAKHYFKNKLEQSIIEKIVDAMFNVQTLSHALKPVAPLFKALADIKKQGNYKIFLLTNLDKETYLALLKLYPKLFALFDGIVISGILQLLKPEPEIYRYLLHTYNLKPDETLFFDDQPENVLGAQKLGIDSIVCEGKKCVAYLKNFR